MSKLILCLLMLTTRGISFSQQLSKIDFDVINDSINDSNSRYFYPNLINRLLKLDTNLTADEFRYLYYGSVFQENYHPYGATEKEVQFNNALDAEKTGDSLLNIGLAVFYENPINLDVILQLTYLYGKNGQTEKAIVFANIYVSFLEVIYASGTGHNCESGFVVVSVDDEYLIAKDLGLKVVHQDLIGVCDLLVFSKSEQPRKTRIKELYFNARMPLSNLSKSFNQSELPRAEPLPDEDE
ncbi:DUF4919 domain-containing protein [Crocinitomix algicola]|uniref:DUF4919 domain-containing protein n=1 Tax=Crocinitomix algicola TaxID=1740263 RepID=UPI0009F6B0E2|nr:DUF4919 domain-containing protein [Crocinitomix algicola]